MSDQSTSRAKRIEVWALVAAFLGVGVGILGVVHSCQSNAIAKLSVEAAMDSVNVAQTSARAAEASVELQRRALERELAKDEVNIAIELRCVSPSGLPEMQWGRPPILQLTVTNLGAPTTLMELYWELHGKDTQGQPLPIGRLGFRSRQDTEWRQYLERNQVYVAELEGGPDLFRDFASRTNYDGYLDFALRVQTSDGRLFWFEETDAIRQYLQALRNWFQLDTLMPPSQRPPSAPMSDTERGQLEAVRRRNSARLIQLQDAQSRWEENYLEDIEALFDAQDEIKRRLEEDDQKRAEYERLQAERESRRQAREQEEQEEQEESP